MGKDIIEIKGLKVFANHGVFESEKENGQEFLVDIKLFCDLCKPKATDELNDTINYAVVCDLAADFLKNTAFDLIEKAAYELSKELLTRYRNIDVVNIKLHKPNAPLEVEFEDVSVNITNRWNEAYIGIGSNMGDKKGNIKKALCQLENDDHFKDVVSTKLIKTKPYGGVEQDDFLNGAIRLKTVYDPFELLDVLHELEKEAGRERSIHWGPRTLDLDILFYENMLIDSEDLKIPHVDMENRYFVLAPLMELCPEKMNPRTAKSISQMYESVDKPSEDKKKSDDKKSMDDKKKSEDKKKPVDKTGSADKTKPVDKKKEPSDKKESDKNKSDDKKKNSDKKKVTVNKKELKSEKSLKEKKATKDKKSSKDKKTPKKTGLFW